MKRTTLLFQSGTDTIDITQPGGIDRLLAFHRGTFGDARMEDGEGDGGSGSGDNGGTGSGSGTGSGGAAGNQDGKDGDLGFPKETPIAQMTAEQQAAYWKHQARKHESRVNAIGDVEKLRADSAELERIRREGMSDNDKALADARAEADAAARADERAKGTTKIFAATFRAAIAGRIEAEKVSGLIEPLNPQHFLTSEGEVDTDKVQQYVDGIAPAGTKKWPDMGQGRRGGSQKSTGVGSGKSLFEERHQTKQS
jgi:hypothetical protein